MIKRGNSTEGEFSYIYNVLFLKINYSSLILSKRGGQSYVSRAVIFGKQITATITTTIKTKTLYTYCEVEKIQK